MEGISIEKKPWLAVTLSWILPGLGQYYCGYLVRGIFCFLSVVLFYILSLLATLSTKINGNVMTLMILIYLLILPILICIDAFRLAKRKSSNPIESEQSTTNDRWKAIFFSILFPGFGHIYLKKYFFAALLIVTFLFLRSKLSESVYFPFISIFIYMFACSHAYVSAYSYDSKKQAAKVLIIFLAFFALMKGNYEIIKPYLVGKYIGQVSIDAFGASMEPTMTVGDKVIINKLIYRWQKPKRGDIIALKMPENVEIPKNIPKDKFSFLCKRIAAAGGDSIRVELGQIFLITDQEKIPDPNDLYKHQDVGDSFGVHYPYIVPENHYFVLGDNLQNSTDSRNFGSISKDMIIGKVVRIYWPLSRANVFP